MGKAETNRSSSPVGNMPPRAKSLGIQNSPIYNIPPQIAVKFISLWFKSYFQFGNPFNRDRNCVKKLILSTFPYRQYCSPSFRQRKKSLLSFTNLSLKGDF